jgi:hypothetical protein
VSQRAKDEICENCGQPSQEHWALNYTDGPMVSGTVLVCPTAVFLLQRGPKRKRKDKP